jgi:hypothetical protein
LPHWNNILSSMLSNSNGPFIRMCALYQIFIPYMLYEYLVIWMCSGKWGTWEKYSFWHPSVSYACNSCDTMNKIILYY